MSLKLPPYPTEYIEIKFLEENADVKRYSALQTEQVLPFAASGVINGSIKSALNITQGDDVKKVTEICLKLKENCLTYQPGYTIGVIPQNCNIEVKKLINRLNYNEFSEKLFTVSTKESNTKKKFKIPSHVPVIGCIKDMLLNNLDIRSIPKKTFLRALSKYTTCEEEVITLNKLCSQGSTTYMQFITSEYVPLLELLKIFPSCYPPFTILLEHLPRLFPRPYSIICSPLQFDSLNPEIHFIYSETPLSNFYEGVCTSWMNKLTNQVLENNAEKITIPFYLRKPNKFVLPDDLETNLIMIGTGTGIAPFISFLRQKELEKREKCGSVWFFYGCRYSDKDFLYKNEIKEWVNSGVITKLFTSFSRERTINNIKYVQDNIVENSKDFVDMLYKDTVLYVCGGKNMSNDLFQTIIQCIQKIKCISFEDAELYVNNLKKSNKYIEDIWD